MASGRQQACESEIFCHGSILDTIQRAELFLDPKRFVDMPTKHPKSVVLSNFHRLNASQPSAQELMAFLHENFHRAGHELRIVMPPDYKHQVPAFDGIKDSILKEFAYDIHSKWKSLLRQVDKSILCSECESTSLNLPYPFLVPGGRFREYYYWDTYWILEGIYVSGMCKTAKAVVENTLWMAKEYGFVPNGSRAYYLNRSQPPMLPMIVESYLEHCGGGIRKLDSFIERALHSLSREHAFWMERRRVSVADAQGNLHVLNRFSADMEVPRPESYMHDIRLADNMTDSASSLLFHNIAATTESGWDFSGRWLNWSSAALPGLEHIITADIVPVDLNSILFRNELIIAGLYERIGNQDLQKNFLEMSEARKKAIDAVLFVPSLGTWKDYNLAMKGPMLDRPFYITDICPLWYGPYKDIPAAQVEGILEANSRIMYGYPGGIPISETYTGQQWDFPNVWAPTQYLAVKLHLRLFHETQNPEHYQKALSIAQKWVTTTYCGFRHYGYIFEKYNAKVVGQPGGGGEYIVQEGFGWSNGVLLWMLREFSGNLTAPEHCPNLPINSLNVKSTPVDPFEDPLTVFVWVMTVLLCCTYAVVACARLRRPRPTAELEPLRQFTVPAP